ncbi:MAG: hypothetical protein NTV66_08440 [Methylococcales bacterium]|jgi:hypothetical protein|nr:hypothetical protein [Methylococcales bacterium]
MKTIKSDEPGYKKDPLQSVKPNKQIINNEEKLMDLFPLPRYFQIHFEHIHHNSYDVQGKLNHINQDIQDQLDELKKSLVRIEDKIDAFFISLENKI